MALAMLPLAKKDFFFLRILYLETHRESPSIERDRRGSEVFYKIGKEL